MGWKIFPGLSVKGFQEELLAILIGEKKESLALSKLDNSTGKEQAKAVSNALYD